MKDSKKYFDPASKKYGAAHVVAATQYSMGGLRRAAGEQAFRHELAAAVIILLIYVWAGAGWFAYVGSLCLFLATFAVEAINTAIELVVDRTSPEISQYGREAKDLGSFAVFCLLCANGVFFAWALWTALA
ncbi:diacylglycerol kinase [Salaquimonas pukyongi]|uniref:diacylglycerol kinase n=1 Tax=Salaquimonas pukyongi TaxID=2712698 RepID=UPI001FCDDCEF|nr:diacylglycerol kinase [Salaquimonas pukyongi]